MEKALFLDIDGVLNNTASLAMGIHLLPEKCLLVSRIVDATDCGIVVSSTWRKLYEQDYLREMLGRVGLWMHVGQFDYTPEFGRGTRGMEINAWLNTVKGVKNYIIIDDDSDMLPEQKPHFIQTNHNVGLTERDTRLAIDMLSKPTL